LEADDQRSWDTLQYVMDDILAALVDEIGAAGSRCPDCLLQALVDAEWTSVLSLYRADGVLDDRTAERARLRRREFPELAQPTSMRRHRPSYFPVLPEKILPQVAFDEEDRAPWASRLEVCSSPNAPSVTKHVDEPMIVVYPGQCRVSIPGVGELAIRPMWWWSFRAGDDFTVHFSKKGRQFRHRRWYDLCKLARQL
jgi:hypothetical protein